MFFLSNEFNAELNAGERSYGRKMREMLMSLVLERRASKDEILELYLNDVYLGQRGSFAIHGVAEASRLFFGKDVANLSISERRHSGYRPVQSVTVANPKRASNAATGAAAMPRGLSRERKAATSRALRLSRDRGQRGALLR